MSGELPRLAVLIPARDMVDTQYACDFAYMLVTTAQKGIKQYTMTQTGASLSRQRESLADYALSTDCTHLLWLDTDMRFPPDTALRLLAHKAPAVAAGYMERSAPAKPLVYTEATWQERVWTTEESKGLQEVLAAGFGCALFERWVFEEMPKPRFLMPWIPDTSPAQGGYLQEDLFFFLKLREMDVRLQIDHDLTKQVAHIGRYEYRVGGPLVADR